MTRIIVEVADQTLLVDVDCAPALGWRFWTFAGFPDDPWDPRPYGRSRGIPLACLKTQGGDLWLTAMELDGSAQLWSTHSLFPCEDQTGAAEFGRAWIAHHLEQPRLFDQ